MINPQVQLRDRIAGRVNELGNESYDDTAWGAGWNACSRAAFHVARLTDLVEDAHSAPLADLLADIRAFQQSEDGTDEYPDWQYLMEHVAEVLEKVVDGS